MTPFPLHTRSLSAFSLATDYRLSYIVNGALQRVTPRSGCRYAQPLHEGRQLQLVRRVTSCTRGDFRGGSATPARRRQRDRSRRTSDARPGGRSGPGERPPAPPQEATAPNRDARAKPDADTRGERGGDARPAGRGTGGATDARTSGEAGIRPPKAPAAPRRSYSSSSVT